MLAFGTTVTCQGLLFFSTSDGVSIFLLLLLFSHSSTCFPLRLRVFLVPPPPKKKKKEYIIPQSITLKRAFIYVLLSIVTTAERHLRKMRACPLLRLSFLLATPFDHQPVVLPSIPTAASVVQGIVPAKSELSRVDELQLLLRHLPEACNRAKELQHDAQYASRYYRARFHRGSQLQQKQLSHVVALNPQKAQQWARQRLHPVSDPFQCS